MSDTPLRDSRIVGERSLDTRRAGPLALACLAVARDRNTERVFHDPDPSERADAAPIVSVVGPATSRGLAPLQEGTDHVCTPADFVVGSAARFVRRVSPYLQYWVNWFTNGTIDFTWEFELGAYLLAKGFTISVQDELSLLLFPGVEERGPARSDWLHSVISRNEAQLGSVDLRTLPE